LTGLIMEKGKGTTRGGCRARLMLAAAVVVLALAVFPAAQQPGTPPAPAQEGFVPVDQLPPEEVLPAAPLVIGAYAVAWVAVFIYLWSIWQRTSRVERDLAELSRRVAAGGPR
jgi:hypothetical protein